MLDRTGGSRRHLFHPAVPEFAIIQPDRNGKAEPSQVRDLSRDAEDFGPPLEDES